jgi:organic radical activating enzyme
MQLKLARDQAGAPEIFRSLQGEGPMAGRVRTFVRLSGCNLHCVWCDTAYTWNWAGSGFRHERDAPGRPYKFDPAAEMVKLTVEEAHSRIRALPSEGVVVTGGEPLLQADAVAALADAIKRGDPGRRIEMETNGTIAPGALATRIDLFVVSPKLAHSGNDPAVALNRPVLRQFAALETAAFKFVARTAGDVDEVAAIAAELRLAPQRIHVMPEGVASAALTARGRELIGPVLAHNFNYSDRLHIHLFGDRRGA